MTLRYIGENTLETVFSDQRSFNRGGIEQRKETRNGRPLIGYFAPRDQESLGLSPSPRSARSDNKHSTTGLTKCSPD